MRSPNPIKPTLRITKLEPSREPMHWKAGVMVMLWVLAALNQPPPR